MKNKVLTMVTLLSIFGASTCFADGFDDLSFTDLPPGSSIVLRGGVLFPGNQSGSENIHGDKGGECQLYRVHSSPYGYELDPNGVEPSTTTANESLSVISNVRDLISHDGGYRVGASLILSTPDQQILALACGRGEFYVTIGDLKNSSELQITPAHVQTIGSVDLKTLGQLNGSSHLLRSPAFDEAQVNLNGSKEALSVSASVSSQDARSVLSSHLAE
jgi:hypothetical protein